MLKIRRGGCSLFFWGYLLRTRYLENLSSGAYGGASISRRDLDEHTSEVVLFCFHALMWSGGSCLLCLISRRDLTCTQVCSVVRQIMPFVSHFSPRPRRAQVCSVLFPCFLMWSGGLCLVPIPTSTLCLWCVYPPDTTTTPSNDAQGQALAHSFLATYTHHTLAKHTLPPS